MDRLCNILTVKGFVSIAETGYDLTYLGKIAANLHEIHPLIGSHLFVYLSDSAVYSKEIVAIFSTFADVKVPDEYRCTSFRDAFIQRMLDKITEWSREYESLEALENTETGIHYDNMLQCDLIEDILEWCTCDTEEQCKYFIQCRSDKISLGDFTKVILKIIVITNEFISVCENTGNIEFLSKLKLIEGMVRKYVATNQSLYI
jgi:hypothetical protein